MLEDFQLPVHPFPTRTRRQIDADSFWNEIRTMTLSCKSLHSSRKMKRMFLARLRSAELTQKGIDGSIVKIVKFVHESAGEEFGDFIPTTMEVQRDQRITTDGEIIRHAHILDDEHVSTPSLTRRGTYPSTRCGDTKMSSRGIDIHGPAKTGERERDRAQMSSKITHRSRATTFAERTFLK